MVAKILKQIPAFRQPLGQPLEIIGSKTLKCRLQGDRSPVCVSHGAIVSICNDILPCSMWRKDTWLPTSASPPAHWRVAVGLRLKAIDNEVLVRGTKVLADLPGCEKSAGQGELIDVVLTSNPR
jgi:hypothetical protein